MNYKLNILRYAFIVGCLIPVSDIPISISFENPVISSPFTQALEYSMHAWSDIRTAAHWLQDQPNQDDYQTYVYAILGQLLCLDHTLNECNSIQISDDDSAYLTRVVSKIKEEATQLSLSPTQEHAMKQLFEAIERTIDNLK